MTTSYELSLKLKELGVEQSNGECYWVYHLITDKTVLSRQSSRSDFFVEVCRALTLGELVRELGDDFNLLVRISDNEWTVALHGLTWESPEEAAGELLAEIKSQELKQKEG